MAGRTRWALALIGCVALIYGATTAARAQGGGGFCDSRIGLQTYNPDLGWVTVHTNLHCINQCPPDQNGNPSTCTFINMSYGVLNYTICGCVPQGGQNQGQGRPPPGKVARPSRATARVTPNGTTRSRPRAGTRRSRARRAPRTAPVRRAGPTHPGR
jgi:hypothetical protein